MNWMWLVQLLVPFHEKMEEFMPIQMSEKLVEYISSAVYFLHRARFAILKNSNVFKKQSPLILLDSLLQETKKLLTQWPNQWTHQRSWLTRTIANCSLEYCHRTPSRKIFRYIFRHLERLIILTSKLIQRLEDLGVLHLLCLRQLKDYKTPSPRQNTLSKARRLLSKKPKLKRVKSTWGN